MVVLSCLVDTFDYDKHNVFQINNTVRDKVNRFYKYVLGYTSYLVEPASSSIPRVFDCFIEFNVDEIDVEVIRMLSLEFFAGFKAMCSVKLRKCIIISNPLNLVKSIEFFDWREYWSTSMKHRLVSTKYVLSGCCSPINRLYIREDGALVVSHDSVCPHVHVLYLRPKT